MSPQEALDRVKAFRRYNAIGSLLVLLIVVAMGGFFILLGRLMDVSPAWAQAVGVLIMICVLGGFLYIGFRNYFATIRRLSLVCPSCSKALVTSIENGEYLKKTGACLHCGARVVGEDTPDQGDT